MNIFVAQLNQLLMSANEDDWLTGLCDLIRDHTTSWVRLIGRGGRLLMESLPLDGTYPSDDILLPDNTTSMDNSRSNSEVHVADIPIKVGEISIGRLTLSRQSPPFDENELQIANIAISVCTLLLRQRERQAQIQRRQRLELVRGAINALSFSELEAAIHIIQAVNGPEGLLVAGHIADKLGFTRSVVVNALKKLEGAGVIETRSLGVKGTYIRIRDLILVEELGKLGR